MNRYVSLPRPAVMVACFLLGMLLSLGVAFAGVANASTGIDPEADPLGVASLVYRLWKGGQLVPAVIVGVFAALVLASRKVAWLKEGRRAVYTTAIVAGLAMIAEPASRGTTPNVGMIVAALAAMAALIFPPQPPAKPEATEAK